ncbi:Acyl-CoA dehydrogenase [Pelotomaculum schinkii]|uniref:Acyl-CoA dehydrogenase n=1 Tax=Pelotomaculum schinkii TaxID=78350 RepID=A0A4Y7R721_9FIRM|nr:acyl-CoA dehydrogenase family protein [Pelotomaculum schinkii]TEB04420.1 Acyl-CoA dehydrogenase [Pelotomaculum schinkii]
MLKLSEQQELLRKAVRDFVENEIAPIAQKIHDEDTCPVELFKKMAQLGFNGVFVPTRYGGTGLGHIEQAIILEEVGRRSAGFAATLVAHYMGVYAIMNWGSEEQKLKYLPMLCSGAFGGFSITEPGGGSDFAGQKATGQLVDGDWVLNGRKCFITNSHCMGVNVMNVNTGKDAKGRPQISVFIIEGSAPGHTPGRKEKKAGLRGSYTGEVILNNVRLPQSNLLGQLGDGAKISLGTLGVMGRGGTAAVAVGILRACLEESVKFAKERIIYGKPLSKLANIQFLIAQNRTDYEAARLLTYNAMGMKDADLPNTAEISMAKFFAAEAAVNAAKRTMDLMGGYGLVADYPVSRYLLDAMGTIPCCGTSHIMQVIIAGEELRK